MTHSKTALLVTALACTPLISGCLAAAAAGAVGAVVISQEVNDNNSYVSHINQDVKRVWPTVKIFLADTSLDPIEADDIARTAKARVDSDTVIVAVEAYDMDKTRMRVSARRYGVNDGEMARLIMERIHRRLEEQSGT